MGDKEVQMPARPLKPGQCRRWLRRTLAEQLPGMVRTFFESRERVSSQDIKLVVALLEETDKKSKRGRRFMDRLLDDLRREEAADGRGGAARERDSLGRWVRK